jgi:hypothetical protein
MAKVSIFIYIIQCYINCDDYESEPSTQKNNFLAIACELFLCDVKVVAKKGGNGG